MNTENLHIISQLIETMEESVKKLEKYQHEGDIEKFKEAKKNILQIQTKIYQILEEKNDT